MNDEKLRRPVPLLWEFVVLASSIAMLSNFLIFVCVPISEEVALILQVADILVCCVFLIDFLILFYLHVDRMHYLITWGWIDLLGSLPLLGSNQFIRIFRIFRAIRILRKGTRFFRLLVSKRRQVTLITIFILFIFVILFSSAAILVAESGSGSKINTVGTALWFTMITMTTTGYGDIIPVTPLGRIVASFTMVIGIGILGAFAALVTSVLVKPQKEDLYPLTEEIESLRKEWELLRNAQERNHPKEKEDS